MASLETTITTSANANVNSTSHSSRERTDTDKPGPGGVINREEKHERQKMDDGDNDDGNEGAAGGDKIEEKPTFIGIVGTNRWSDQGMETGYALNKKFWGRGYATEAFMLFLDYYWGLSGEI